MHSISSCRLARYSVRSFLQAKINFFKALVFIFKSTKESNEGLLKKLDTVLGDALYFKLAEELLIRSIANVTNPIELKKSAAQLVIPMWEQPHSLPLQDFTNLLLSAWRARSTVQEVLGTLAGFHEVVSLLNAECEPRFLDFFNQESTSPDARQALREFLFAMGYEDLQALGHYMEGNNVSNMSTAEAARILGHNPYHFPLKLWTPEIVYYSYRRRRIRAQYRVQARKPGPRKTAEG